MRIETNVRVIKRNRQIAQYAFFVSMGVWLASLAVTFLPVFTERQTDQLGWLELAATLVLPFALGLALFAVYMTNLWIREPRPERIIREIGGMNQKSVLYQYYHSPAKHVLVAPQGIYVMIVRWQRGDIEIDGDKWRFKRSILARIPSIFRLESLGNPVAEAERARDYLNSLLEPIAPDTEIQPLILITDPRTTFTIKEPSPFPVLYANDEDVTGKRDKEDKTLTEYMREQNKAYKQRTKGNKTTLPLSDEQIKAFEEATLPATE